MSSEDGAVPVTDYENNSQMTLDEYKEQREAKKKGCRIRCTKIEYSSRW